MIYKWNELEYTTFNEEVLQKFEEGAEWTKNKVLEIQDPFGIIIGKTKRIFLGLGIRAEDFSKYDDKFMGLLKALASGIPDLLENKNCVSIFMISSGAPRVLPLMGKDGKTDFTFVRHTMFNDLDKDVLRITNILGGGAKGPQLWYEKNSDGKREFWVPARKNVNKYVRFRTIDLEDWKRLITNWLDNDEREELTEKDLTVDDFTIMPEAAQITLKLYKDGELDETFGD